jgi:hypothetical protein
MRHLVIRLAVLTTLASGASLAMAFSSGPPAARTGAPAVGGVVAEATCTACHMTFPLNAPGATLEILDVPQFYIPNQTYPLRVRLTSTFAPPRRWGFQITAVRDADGQGVGTFDIGASTTLQIVNGAGTFATRRYVEHLSAGTFPNNNGPIEWSFNWVAPSTDLGRIRFFAAGNAANNNSANTGDHIYTQSAQTDPHPLLDVDPAASRDAIVAAHPNPSRGRTAIAFSLARAGGADLGVFDAQGRTVRSLISGDRAAGPGSAVWDGARDDGSAAGPGVYFIRLVTAGSPGGISRTVVLVR